MILGHGGTHDENGVCVAEVLLRGGGTAAPEGCAQTGHSRAMSYPGLVADADHAQPSRKQFLDQIVFFVIESRSAEMSYGGGLHQGFAITRFLEGAVARVPYSVGDHVHRGFEIEFLPATGIGRAILYCLQPSGVRVQFEGVRSLRAKMAAGDRRLRVALNTNQLALFVVDELSASYTAVRTDGPGNFCTLGLGAQLASALRHGFRAGAIHAGADLFDQRPAGEKRFEHGCSLTSSRGRLIYRQPPSHPREWISAGLDQAPHKFAAPVTGQSI